MNTQLKGSLDAAAVAIAQAREIVSKAANESRDFKQASIIARIIGPLDQAQDELRAAVGDIGVIQPTYPAPRGLVAIASHNSIGELRLELGGTEVAHVYRQDDIGEWVLDAGEMGKHRRTSRDACVGFAALMLGLDPEATEYKEQA